MAERDGFGKCVENPEGVPQDMVLVSVCAPLSVNMDLLGQINDILNSPSELSLPVTIEEEMVVS